MSIMGKLAALMILVVIAAGCPRTEGPAEQTGEQVDQAVDETGEAVGQAGERVQDAAD